MGRLGPRVRSAGAGTLLMAFLGGSLAAAGFHCVASGADDAHAVHAQPLEGRGDASQGSAIAMQGQGGHHTGHDPSEPASKGKGTSDCHCFGMGCCPTAPVLPITEVAWYAVDTPSASAGGLERTAFRKPFLPHVLPYANAPPSPAI